MANRPKGFGMTAELARKREAKFDSDVASEAFAWMHDVLQQGHAPDNITSLVANDVSSEKDVSNALKNGILLCHLINCLKSGSVKKINENNMAFKQMENIGNFLTACESVGCKKADLFQTVDLYESNNIPQVINGIFALGRKAQNFYDGPRLGPEEATANKREFTEDQLRAGEGVIGLQAGSNKGASQAGQNFGKTRAIID